jgi:8-oxo-dGTP pyrophosphatase MutT (NUDIX family)
LEETGLQVGKLTLIDVVDSIHHDADGFVQFHYTILDFAALYRGGTPAPASDVSDLAWVHPRDFETYGLWHEASRVIGKAILRMRFGK